MAMEYEKKDHLYVHEDEPHHGLVPTDSKMVDRSVNRLQKGLSGFHTSMIAIGGAIGAGLFVSAGGAFAAGGPASVFLGFTIIGIMMWMVMQALGELCVLYPQPGAFNTWNVRFIDPSWGFAMANIYAISWLTVLPFELTAAGLTINYWNVNVNIGVWITVFLVALFIVQLFGVRAYGYSEVVLSGIKVLALVGFCLFAIIDNCGGVPTDPRGYIGGKYWTNGDAFLYGFPGFCGVFTTAAFSFGGTELVGLTAAETKDPAKQLPKAIRQTLWRIVLFYLVSLLLVGLIVPSTNPHLLKATSTAHSKYSIFVIALKKAGVSGLPSVFNVVICLSVLSVANSCTYGSTRTFQALASMGMYPRWMAYVDKRGRPVPTILLQVAFALLAYINCAPTVGTYLFEWLLALTAIAYFFVWGSICLSHIRFRMAWAYNGRSVEELPYRATFGVYGSYLGIFLNFVSLMASFYVAIAPAGVVHGAEHFFSVCMAIPLIIIFYVGWKVYSWIYIPEHRPLYIKIKDIDIYAGMREDQSGVKGANATEEERRASIHDQEERRKLTVFQRVKVVLTSCF